MDPELCFPQWGFDGTNQGNGIEADEYGGSAYECIKYIQANAPDSDLNAATLRIPPEKLPSGRNY